MYKIMNKSVRGRRKSRLGSNRHKPVDYSSISHAKIVTMFFIYTFIYLRDGTSRVGL